MQLLIDPRSTDKNKETNSINYNKNIEHTKK